MFNNHSEFGMVVTVVFPTDLGVFHVKFGVYLILWFCDYRDLVGSLVFPIFVVSNSEILLPHIPTSGIRARLSSYLVSLVFII